MMNPRPNRKRKGERGQSFLMVLMFVSLLLLGVLGVATDYSQIWAHRQMAQGAADAACQAAAADLYLNAVGVTGNTWIGTDFDCSTNTTSAPCVYASRNGYTGSGVAVTFPSSLPGVASLPITVPTPYVRVTVTDPVTMGFTKLLYPNGTFNITAKAGCGVLQVNSKIPLLVLNLSGSPTFQLNGSSSIKIEGGPIRSIQVDSSSASATSINTNAVVDLSKASPAGTGGDFATGGAQSSPSTPSPLNLGTTGHWLPSSLPLSDPFANVAAPSKPATKGSAFAVAFAVNGCPDPDGCVEFTAGDYTACSSSGNQVWTGGATLSPPNSCPVTPKFGSPYGAQWTGGTAYAIGALIVPTSNNPNNFMFRVITAGTTGSTQPVWSNHALNASPNSFTDGGVTWTNMGPISTSPNTAIFDPGLYYIGSSGLQPPSNSTVRTSTAAGDGTGGVMFYFSLSNSAGFGSNTGAAGTCTSVTVGASSWSGSPNKCLVQYNVDGSSSFGVASRMLRCDTTSPPNPSDVASSFSGNILLGPCTGTYGGGVDPSGTYTGNNRGFLFFQNRTTAANGGTCTAGLGGGGGNCAILGGGGSYIFSGYTYFHMNTGATGTACGTSMSCLTYAGSSGNSSLTLGNIVVDAVSLTGGGSLEMVLNSYTSFPVLKPSLLE